MSGIVAVWRLDGASEGLAASVPIRGSLRHRAINGQGTWSGLDGAMALGHLHFWTTPEEVGEQQPIVDGGVALALDGRLDNRSDLAAALGITPSELSALSDAALALRAFRAWGEGCFHRLAGVFAIVIMDSAHRQVLWARDPMGRRTLCTFRNRRWLLLASEPGALLAHPAVSADLDDVWLANLFAVRSVGDGRTFYSAIREALPGWAVCFDGHDERAWRTWEPDLEPRVGAIEDGALIEEFGDLVRQAVARRMRSARPVGVLMSGGLDSTIVAALAAGSAQSEQPLKTVSYVYDELTECDERQYIHAMVQRHHLDPTYLLADEAWPLQGLEQWPFDPNQPKASQLWYLWDRVDETANAAGIGCLLSGHGGDELYGGAEYWLADLLAAGRWPEGWRETREHARRLGWGAVLRSNSLRRVVAGALGSRPRADDGEGALGEWLTPAARQLLAEAPPGPPDLRRSRPTHALGPGVGSEALVAGPRYHRARLETRRPYRDRDLVSFSLRLPAYWLYNQGAVKRILRDSLGHLLPEEILARRQPTYITSLIQRGFERNADFVYRTVVQPAQLWRRFVREDWLAAVWPCMDMSYPASAVVWSCITTAFWEQGRDAHGWLVGPRSKSGGHGAPGP